MPKRPASRLLLPIFTAALLVVPAIVEPVQAADPEVVVQPGDTLSALAVRHGTTVRELAALNSIRNPDRIFVGQTIRLPAAEPREPAAPAPQVHVVRSGETLWGIARRHGATVAALVEANGLANPSLIHPGQRLVVGGATVAPGAQAPVPAPPAAPAPVVEATPAVTQHRVGAGDTLWGIARRYRTSVSALVQANTLANPSLIRPGQVLAIPGGTAPAPASAGPVTVGGSIPSSMRVRVAEREAVGRLVAAEAANFGVPAALALGLAWQESGWRQQVVSSAGAVGVMQLMPGTADWVAATMLGETVDVHDLRSNVRAGMRLLRHYLDRYGGDRSLALAAYFQGQGGTDRHGIYPSSRPYVASVLALEGLFAGW